MFPCKKNNTLPRNITLRKRFVYLILPHFKRPEN